ncbi:MAG: PQQ-binding-like beta-propeller repeat protein [Planctomycetes bacterium]|nr:PQQ-binding-like beta-propeller repeat protein [Planctomycetota bacterium]
MERGEEALPTEQGHRTASLTSASPVTDGERLIVNFGSYGLYALDLGGELLWKADLGPVQVLHGHGEGSSPALHGDALVVNWDHEGQSFIAAFDVRSGRERWKVPRDEVTSWATPIVVEHAGRPQVIASGTTRVRGYDLATGSVIWECGGLSANVVASPVAGDGMAFAGNGLTLVLEDGDAPRVLARNRLDDSFSASAAIAGKDLFLRGHRSLYCLADR